jgi:hypothetical protein
LLELGLADAPVAEPAVDQRVDVRAGEYGIFGV